MYTNFEVVGPYDVQRTVNFNAEETLNWYVIQDPRGKKEQALVGTPGLQFEYELSTTNLPTRQMISVSNKLYIIAGNVVLLDNIQIGTINTVSGFISFAINNAGQVLFVDGVFGYILDVATDTVTQITDPDFPPSPVSCAYLAGFFIVVNGQTIQFYISAPEDGTKWDFQDVAQVNSYGGNLIAVGVVNKRLFLFKQSTTEVWYVSGDPDFPFRRDNNLVINDGCKSAATVNQEDGLLFWLSADDSGTSSVLVSEGISVKRVSWDSIDIKIQSFTVIEDVQTYIYKDDGHLFYVLSWTTDDFTFVYDATTDYWHRMEMLPKKFNPLDPLASKVRHISSCHAFFEKKHWIGDYRSNNIYTMSLSYGSNAGDPIRRERIFRHLISPSYKQLQIDALQIDFQSGIGDGLVSIANPDWLPQAYLSVSENGGKSFGPERPAPLGRQGNYLNRTVWRLLGVHRDFVAKVAIYSDVKPIFMLGGAIDVKELTF